MDSWRQYKKIIDDLVLLFELAEEETDHHTIEVIREELADLDKSVREMEMKRMLGSDLDPLNAIISIHAGAGGTEAQDWAEMLLRMYLRWVDRRGFKATIIDYQPCD